MRFDINPAEKGDGFVVTTTDDTGKVISTEKAKDHKDALAKQKAQHKKALEGEDADR